MNFGCQADVFQLPHHRQYLFVSGHACRHYTNMKGYLKKTSIFRKFT